MSEGKKVVCHLRVVTFALGRLTRDRGEFRAAPAPKKPLPHRGGGASRCSSCVPGTAKQARRVTRRTERGGSRWARRWPKRITMDRTSASL